MLPSDRLYTKLHYVAVRSTLYQTALCCRQIDFITNWHYIAIRSTLYQTALCCRQIDFIPNWHYVAIISTLYQTALCCRQIDFIPNWHYISVIISRPSMSISRTGSFRLSGTCFPSRGRLGQAMHKRALSHMRTTQVQISLRIRAVWSAPLFFAA